MSLSLPMRRLATIATFTRTVNGYRNIIRPVVNLADKKEPINKIQSVWLDVTTRSEDTTLISFDGLHKDCNDKKEKKKNKNLLGWEEKFTLMRAFKEVHGHCRVPLGYVISGVNLGGWVATQREEYIKHRFGIHSNIINEKRVNRLERNGFVWDLNDVQVHSAGHYHSHEKVLM